MEVVKSPGEQHRMYSGFTPDDPLGFERYSFHKVNESENYDPTAHKIVDSLEQQRDMEKQYRGLMLDILYRMNDDLKNDYGRLEDFEVHLERTRSGSMP